VAARVRPMAQLRLSERRVGVCDIALGRTPRIGDFEVGRLGEVSSGALMGQVEGTSRPRVRALMATPQSPWGAAASTGL